MPSESVWETVDALMRKLGEVRLFLDQAERDPPAPESDVRALRQAMGQATEALCRIWADEPGSDAVVAAWEAMARAQDMMRQARAHGEKASAQRVHLASQRARLAEQRSRFEEAQRAVAGTQQRIGRAPRVATGPLIAVVDPDETLRIELRQALQGEGYSVVAGTSAAEALLLLRQNAGVLKAVIVGLGVEVPSGQSSLVRLLRQVAAALPVVGVRRPGQDIEEARRLGVPVIDADQAVEEAVQALRRVLSTRSL